MRVTVDIKNEALNDLCRITGQKKKGHAVAFAVKEYVKKEKAKEFGTLLLEGAFDYPATNDEIEKGQG
jgi:hypothetical protein